MRIEWALEGFDLEEKSFVERFEPIAESFEMQWRLEFSSSRPRIAIFVSRDQHCLVDLLYRTQIEELKGDVALIISNHPDARAVASFHDIPYHEIPITKANKLDAEIREIELLEAEGVDLIILARYMQILSPQIVERYPRRIINVHHSFLPAFTGARPYHAAFARGVK